MFCFSKALRVYNDPALETGGSGELDKACRQGGGQAIGGHDDVFALGPHDVVIPDVILTCVKWNSLNNQLSDLSLTYKTYQKD